jgi:23S rRNA pseudouridine2604 synthase
VTYLQYPKRIYPIGRLDKDSSGLLLMTNQGYLVDAILRAGNYHEKEYEVEIYGKITEEFLEKMGEGVYLEELERTTRPCRIWQSGPHSFHIILTQGMNRQIRRMCQALGEQVRTLKRIRIMNLKLGNLKTGTYRKATEAEMEELKRALEAGKKGR